MPGSGYKKGKPRRYGSNTQSSAGAELCDRDSHVSKAFMEYKELLDNKHDKHENLVKISRDVTIESKRIIFQLHRAVGGDRMKIFEEAEEMISKCINTQLLKMARELVNVDWYKHTRAITAGLQEFVEAYTFYYYLKHQTLPNREQVQGQLTFSSANHTEKLATCSRHTDETGSRPDGCGSSIVESAELSVPLSQSDFILGIADLTGELMRMCINSIGWGDLLVPSQLCEILQDLQLAYKTHCSTAGGEMGRKMQTLKQSVSKVENACYTVKVRGSEIPKHMLVDSVHTEGKLAADFDSNSDWL